MKEANVPVDARDYGVQREGGAVQVIQVPYPLANVEAVLRLVDAVEDRGDDGEEPAEEREDLVRGDGLARVRLAPRERVPWERCQPAASGTKRIRGGTRVVQAFQSTMMGNC